MSITMRKSSSPTSARISPIGLLHDKSGHNTNIVRTALGSVAVRMTIKRYNKCSCVANGPPTISASSSSDHSIAVCGRFHATRTMCHRNHATRGTRTQRRKSSGAYGSRNNMLTTVCPVQTTANTATSADNRNLRGVENAVWSRRSLARRFALSSVSNVVPIGSDDSLNRCNRSIGGVGSFSGRKEHLFETDVIIDGAELLSEFRDRTKEFLSTVIQH